MTDQGTPMNRWWVVLGAVSIQLCFGAIYAWSVFTGPLKMAVEDGGYGFTNSQTQLVFSAELGAWAAMVAVGGWLQSRVGPRKTAMLAGLVLGSGYILGGLLGDTFWAQFVCIGLIGGAGVGFGYVVPIAVGVKWFPDKKGLITGLAVAGFGFGATMWVKFAGGFKAFLWLGGGYGGLLKTVSVLGLSGVQSVFFLYGLVFLVLIFLGSRVMVNPPAGYAPNGWTPALSAAQTGAVEYTRREMVRTPQYYILSSIFTCSGMAGVMVIGSIALFGADKLVASGYATADEAKLITGTAAALLSVFNGLGRIVWGGVSDRIGRRMALLLMCCIQGSVLLMFFNIGGTALGLTVGACIVGFNYGGNFALFPAATADLFGNKNVGTNYGWVFFFYGIAGIAGPLMAGWLTDGASAATVQAWRMPFMIAGTTCLVGAALALVLRPVRQRAAEVAVDC